jgi:hypothetical protein
VLNQGRIIELAAPQGLLTMYGWRDFANEGRLMSDDPTWFDPATLSPQWSDKVELKEEKCKLLSASSRSW